MLVGLLISREYHHVLFYKAIFHFDHLFAIARTTLWILEGCPPSYHKYSISFCFVWLSKLRCNHFSCLIFKFAFDGEHRGSLSSLIIRRDLVIKRNWIFLTFPIWAFWHCDRSLYQHWFKNCRTESYKHGPMRLGLPH